jgi:hypothetical protein
VHDPPVLIPFPWFVCDRVCGLPTMLPMSVACLLALVILIVAAPLSVALLSQPTFYEVEPQGQSMPPRYCHSGTILSRWSLGLFYGGRAKDTFFADLWTYVTPAPLCTFVTFCSGTALLAMSGLCVFRSQIPAYNPPASAGAASACGTKRCRLRCSWVALHHLDSPHRILGFSPTHSPLPLGSK